MRVRRGRNLRQENGGNSGKPRLTVIIPVRNGSPYIDSAVRSALQGLGPNDRVLVSLNACVDNTRQLLAEVNDPRLRVIETPHPMSMSRHWDFVRQFVESEWIIYLGHDDGVLPYLTQLLTKLLLRHPSNDVFVFRRALYFWPGVEEFYGKTGWKCNGSFSAKRHFAPIRLWSVILGRGSYADLPMVYANCIVRVSLLESLLEDGKAFRDPAPDVSSAVLLSSRVGSYVYCDVPTFWVGSSPTSNGIAVSQQDEGGAAPEEFVGIAGSFWLESARDGLFLGQTARRLPRGFLGSDSALLSAIENMGITSWWLPLPVVRRILLARLGFRYVPGTSELTSGGLFVETYEFLSRFFSILRPLFSKAKNLLGKFNVYRADSFKYSNLVGRDVLGSSEALLEAGLLVEQELGCLLDSFLKTSDRHSH